MAFTIKNPPEFTVDIAQWTRETDADGAEMAKEIEKLLNNDIYCLSQTESQEHVEPVTLAADGWEGDVLPYTQTVAVDGLTEMDNPLLVRMPPESATEAEQKAYNKAFGIISEGTGETGDGTATFTVYKKPAVDITVGLRGIGSGTYTPGGSGSGGGTASEGGCTCRDVVTEEGPALATVGDGYEAVKNVYHKYGDMVAIHINIKVSEDSSSANEDNARALQSKIVHIGDLDPNILPASSCFFPCIASGKYATAIIGTDGGITVDNSMNDDVGRFLISFTYVCQHIVEEDAGDEIEEGGAEEGGPAEEGSVENG